jgi:hypothetical protein
MEQMAVSRKLRKSGRSDGMMVEAALLILPRHSALCNISDHTAVLGT